jgi:hypothetical protein
VSHSLPIARTAQRRDLELDAAMANRHGLITGATGTGKTVTLQVLADNFSRIGVPVFLADVKGDLSGVRSRPAPARPAPRSESDAAGRSHSGLQDR